MQFTYNLVDKGLRPQLKKVLGDDFKYLNIGYDYYYDNRVTIVPVYIGKHYYAVFEMQYHMYTVSIRRIDDNSYSGRVADERKVISTDNLKDLVMLFSEHLNSIAL